jgi:hypothetical protein
VKTRGSMLCDQRRCDDGAQMHLVLRHASESRASATSSEDDFNVFDGEPELGRIYRVTDEPSSHWFWGLSFELIRRKSYGYALSLDEAKAAFEAEYSTLNAQRLAIART